MYLLKIQSIVGYRILTEDLQLRKYCSVWVPAELTDEHKTLRVKACRRILKRVSNISEYVVHGIRRMSEFRIWLAKKGALKNNVSVCLHLLTPGFSITAIPKGKTINSEYMIRTQRDTGHRLSNRRKNPAMFYNMLYFYRWTMLDPILLLLHSNI